MTASSAVHAPSRSRHDAQATTLPTSAGAEQGSDMLRGIGFGLAFVAPFWTAVAVVLVRVL